MSLHQSQLQDPNNDNKKNINLCIIACSGDVFHIQISVLIDRILTNKESLVNFSFKLHLVRQTSSCKTVLGEEELKNLQHYCLSIFEFAEIWQMHIKGSLTLNEPFPFAGCTVVAQTRKTKLMESNQGLTPVCTNRNRQVIFINGKTQHSTYQYLLSPGWN